MKEDGGAPLALTSSKGPPEKFWEKLGLALLVGEVTVSFSSSPSPSSTTLEMPRDGLGSFVEGDLVDEPKGFAPWRPGKVWLAICALFVVWMENGSQREESFIGQIRRGWRMEVSGMSLL